MDNDQQVQVIQARLDALEGMPVSDDRSAREAFTHVMVTVSRINELSAKARAQAMVGGGAAGDEIAENLRKWLDRLVGALPGIVRELAGAAAFSISVGANVAVTVEFSSSAGSSARDRLRTPAAAGFARRARWRGRPGPALCSWPQGPQRSPGSRGSPQGCRAQRDAEHPWGRRGGPVACAARPGLGGGAAASFCALSPAQRAGRGHGSGSAVPGPNRDSPSSPPSRKVNRFRSWRSSLRL
jgi:hypothetical protein